MTKKFACLASLLSIFVLFLLQTALNNNVYAAEKVAASAIAKAQELVAELDEGLRQAEDLMQQAKQARDNHGYLMARRTNSNATNMLQQARLQLDDAVKMAGDSSEAPNEAAATAATYSSRAKAETAQSFARAGILALEALKFAANGDLDCAEKINALFLRTGKATEDLKKIETLAGQSFDYATATFKNADNAANESEKSVRSARECIALARKINMHLQDFEDICDDFKKRWKNLKDLEDDEEPSPV